MIADVLPMLIQSDKGTAVFLAQNAHQGGKSFTGVAAYACFRHDDRKTDGVYPDSPGAVFGSFVDPINGVDDRLYPIPAEFISKNIQAYFFIC